MLGSKNKHSLYSQVSGSGSKAGGSTVSKKKKKQNLSIDKHPGELEDQPLVGKQLKFDDDDKG